MRIALIGNNNAVFPLLDWLHTQGVLVGVAATEKDNEFFKNFEAVCIQKQIAPRILSKKNTTAQLSEWIETIKADIVLVMAFSHKIKKEVLILPKFGFFNIHFGKLPKYGGGHPAFWQIKNQEKQATLTIHQMDEGYDTGPIAFELTFDLSPQLNYAMLELNFGYLAVNGVYLLIDAILRNALQLTPQLTGNHTFYPKPSLKDIVIDWQTMPASEIVALVKACNPWNHGAIARINGLDLKILELCIKSIPTTKAGQVIGINENQLDVSCINDTAIGIKVVYASIGFLAGEMLTELGVNIGDVFDTISI